MIVNSLDRILVQLQDAKWHSLDELKKSLPLPSDKLNKVIQFLHRLAFIDKKDDKLRITCLGLKFSQL